MIIFILLTHICFTGDNTMYDNDIVPQYAITEPFTSPDELSTMSYNIIVITSLVVQHAILYYRNFTSRRI